MYRCILASSVCLFAGYSLSLSFSRASETVTAESNQAANEHDKSAVTPESPGWIRLDRKAEVWVNRQRGAVMVGGQVCLRDGFLEMFACPKKTKEHESIVSVNSPAYMVHAALLVLGVKEGDPAKFEEKYTPATGREIDVHVVWKDEDGKPHRVRGQEWIREIKSGEPMKYPWVFVGSGFWNDPDTGRRYYHAEGGELICVSNFSTAMMDLPVPSSQTNDDLLFRAYTERIPKVGTSIKLILVPKPKGRR